MVDPNTRQGKRTPVTLKIKFKSETLEQFIERYAVDVSQGGIFIRTKEPLAVGTQMKFEFQLRDASPLIAGEGTVVWTRENDPSRPAIAPGMGVRFDRLAEGSQGVLEKILAEKAKQAPQRGANESPTKPPMFTDTPTRVAPLPVQEALLGNRKRQDSEQTPLPKPMPFHSDADEFGAEAFEEQTKVRSLDELVAQTADTPQDELAARRRADSTSPLADPPPPDDRLKTVPDRDSAPILPSPPEASGRTGRLLDTTPSPRATGSTTPPATRPSQPGLPQASELGKTRLGVEPAKSPTIPPRTFEAESNRASTPRAVAAEPSHPIAPSRPSAAPIIIGILVVVAAAMAAVWFFVLRESSDDVTKKPTVGSGGAIVTNHHTTGSGSTGVALTGSGSAGSAAVVHAPPKGPTVDTEVASTVAKATVTVVDDDQTGPAPFKAKLEKDKMYKVRVAAPGYLQVELDVKGGQDKVTAKLVAKPHVLAVASEPPGAQIFIDNAPTNKLTPADVELTAAQAAKPKVHVQLRKSGFRPVDQMVDTTTGFTDEATTMTFNVSVRLAVMIVINNNNNNTTNNIHNNGSGAGSGSAATTNGSGDHGTGSGATTPTGTGTGSDHATGSGSSTPATGTGAAPPASSLTKPATGSGEPEPDWSKKP